MKNSTREIIGQICPPPLKIVTYLLAVSLASTAGATDFVWTGNGSPNDQWQIPGNWAVGGEACTGDEQYPHTSEDTATFNSGDARVLVTSQTTIGELVISEGANFTHVRDQFLQVGMLSGAGTLKLQNRARFDFVNSSEITVSTTIDVSNNDSGQLILVRGTSAQVNYAGGLTGAGTVQFEGNVKFTGDNSGFEGVLQIHPSSTVEFLSPSSGSANATVSYSGNNKKTSHINLDGDIYFGAFQQTSYGAVDFRVNLGQTGKAANLIIGGNGQDSVIMGSWGDANNNNDRPNSYSKITKVGDKTLRVYCPWHRLGTEIRGGVLEVIGPDALTGRNTSSISPISFSGGTLKYGTDTTTDPANPAPVTTDWSALVSGSTGAISVDTDGKDVTWANDGLQSHNPDALGITKKGEGTLALTGSWHDNSRKFFAEDTYTNRIEYGTLAIRNAKYNAKPDIKSKFLGTGTLEICSQESNGGYRLRGNGAFEEFEGTIDWSTTNSQNSAVGFMMNNGPFNCPNVRFRITGVPEEATNVMKCETGNSTSKDYVTVDAFDHLNPNAVVGVNRKWTLNINGVKSDSYLNGTFADNSVTINKNGTTKLTMGPDFSAPEGSAVNVDEGVFAMDAGMTQADLPSYVKIAEGVAFTGDGVFGAVDLSVHDVVPPADLTPETDHDTVFTLLTATLITGESTAMKKLLDEVNDDETHGKWVVTTDDNGDGTWTLKCCYRKAGLTIILR